MLQFSGRTVARDFADHHPIDLLRHVQFLAQLRIERQDLHTERTGGAVSGAARAGENRHTQTPKSWPRAGTVRLFTRARQGPARERQVAEAVGVVSEELPWGRVRT